MLGFLPAQTQQQAVVTGNLFGAVIHLVLVVLVTRGILAGAGGEPAGWAFAFVALWVGSAVVGTLTAVGISSGPMVGGVLGSLAGLAAAASEIARTGHARIPNTDRSDEFGELARALQAWESATRASSAVENWHSILRPHLAVHRELSSGMVALLAVWHNHRIFRRGVHKGQSPLQLSGVADAPSVWLVALGYPPAPTQATPTLAAGDELALAA